MSRVRRLIFVVLVTTVGAIALAGGAFAANITQPTGSPFVVTTDASGATASFTVSAGGFAPGTLVYVEECDGVPPSAPLWSPTSHCDLGSSPAPAVADANGAVTFRSTDRNHAFHAFAGESPQSMFNCLVPGQTAPSNGLASYTNCALRVSSNNTAITADQTFLAIAFANGRVNPTSTSTRPGATSTTSPPTSKGAPKKTSRVAKGAPTSTSVGHVSAVKPPPGSKAVGGASATHRADVGPLSLSDADLATGYVLLFGGLAIAALTVSLRRRTPPPRSPMIDTKMPGER